MNNLEQLQLRALLLSDIKLAALVNLLRGEALTGNFEWPSGAVRINRKYGSVEGLVRDVVGEPLDFLDFVREEGIDVLFGAQAIEYKGAFSTVTDGLFPRVAASLFVAYHLNKAGYSELPHLGDQPPAKVLVWDEGSVKICSRKAYA